MKLRRTDLPTEATDVIASLDVDAVLLATSLDLARVTVAGTWLSS